MPYTPPAHHSPASSTRSSPSASRRSSIHGTSPTAMSQNAGSATRTALPRSASYLTKHRRTPSAAESTISANGSSAEITPPGTSDDLKGMVANHNTLLIRQSPPPVGDVRALPPGAIMSPPESQSSSEDEGITMESRSRQIDNLKELQDAIKAIPQHRASSPTNDKSADSSLEPSSQGDFLAETARPALSRKVSHSRSNTEPVIPTSQSDTYLTVSEDDSEQDDLPRKPQMVRKKSGELVRPALRPAAHRRPSSMPGTPTFSKAVHFDSHLEHVRHFLQVDRPLAVSAGSSPIDAYESDTEYPFNADDKSNTRSPPFELDIALSNFPAETPIRKALPARMERVWLSPDQKCLVGSIVVSNLAFQKYIVCRFTFDYWKTTSEVVADYSHALGPMESDNGHDRFQFTIKLSDLANLESKTLFFCIRYNVNGLEYWDNNNGMNFQVDFKKKLLPQNGKGNFQGASSRSANSLPRSNRRTSGPRPKSMPTGAFDAFGSDHKFLGFDQAGSIDDLFGEGPIRLKSSKSTTSLPSDNLSNRLSTPSGAAFANRYDFGAALNAAISAHKDSNGSHKADGLCMKRKKKPSFGLPPQVYSSQAPQLASGAPSNVTSKVPGTESPSSAAIASSSYEEIVNKYCFFNSSKQSSPQPKDGITQHGRLDGGVDDFFSQQQSSSNSSYDGSPVMMEKSRDNTLRYAVHQNLGSYFQSAHTSGGASPSESPLNGPSAVPRHTTNILSSTSTVDSACPTSTPGSYSPHAGTSSPHGLLDSPSFKHAQHLSSRFPFSADAHSSTAIRG